MIDFCHCDLFIKNTNGNTEKPCYTRIRTPMRGLIANRVSRVFVLIGTQVILDIIEDGYIMVFLAFARKCLNSVLETHLKFFASYAKFGDSWRENIVR